MRYYVNTKAQDNGDHEVHIAGCGHFPHEEHARYLGDFPSCHGAVREAQRYYTKANGCFYCSPQCNTG